MSKTVIVKLDAIETITKTADMVIEVPDGISTREIEELVMDLDLQNDLGLDWRIDQQGIEFQAPSVTVPTAPLDERDMEIRPYKKGWMVQVSYDLACRRDRRKNKLADILLRNGCWDAVIDYAREVLGGRWPEAEDRIYEERQCEWILRYANSVIRGRWPRAETIIVGTKWEKQYALEVLPGHWDEEVAAMCPCWLYYYAKDVIGGKLPDHLHNLMLAESIKNSDDPWAKKYLAAKKYRTHPASPTPHP